MEWQVLSHHHVSQPLGMEDLFTFMGLIKHRVGLLSDLSPYNKSISTKSSSIIDICRNCIVLVIFWLNASTFANITILVIIVIYTKEQLLLNSHGEDGEASSVAHPHHINLKHLVVLLYYLDLLLWEHLVPHPVQGLFIVLGVHWLDFNILLMLSV